MNAGISEKQQANDGYVSLLNPDGSVHTAKWIGVTRDGFTHNHPLGSAIHDGVLYTADIDTVRTFDLATGKPGKAYPVPGATIRNGIVILKDGTKYVSSVKFGSVSKIVPGKEAEVIASGIPSAASMGYDSKQNQLVIPMNNNNAVAFISLGK